MVKSVHATDPHQITDPQMAHHTRRRAYVYFEEFPDCIKFGYVGSFADGLKRRAQYALQGAHLLAVLPGGYFEEQQLLAEFGPPLRGLEYMRPEECVYEYIESLLECGFAAPTYQGAEYLGAVDYKIWRPGASALKHAEAEDGTLSLFPTLPVRERIQILSKSFGAMSLTDDWYTPKKWTDLARTVMGDIDLDPASCKQANDECVGAAHWYTKEQNGLNRQWRWYGRLWLNPPYGKGHDSAKAWIARLYDEVKAGKVQQAVTCLNLGAMCNKWFVSKLAPIASAHCIPCERIEFVPRAGDARTLGSASNGTVFTYVGPNVDRFVRIYSPHGQVLVPGCSSAVLLEAAE